MINFTINAGRFKHLLEYVYAKGLDIRGKSHPIIENCIITVDKKELDIKAIDRDEIIIINADMKLKTPPGETGLIALNLEDSLITLSRFDKATTIKVIYDEEAKITYFKHNKNKRPIYRRELLQLENVDTHLDDLSEFPYKYNKKINVWKLFESKPSTVYIEIDASQFDEILKDAALVDFRIYPIKITKSEIIVDVEDKNTGKGYSRNLEALKLEVKKPAESMFVNFFGNIFGAVSGKIKIWMAHENSIIVHKEEDDMTVTYILSSTEMEEEESDNSDKSEDDIIDDIKNDFDEAVDDEEDDEEEDD